MPLQLIQRAVRQEGLSRLERAQQRQGLVPDLRITVPPLLGRHSGGAVGSQENEEQEEERTAARAAAVWNGNARVSPVLDEMKVISCSKDWWLGTLGRSASPGTPFSQH